VPKTGPQAESARKESVPSGDRPPIPVTYVPARNTIFLSFALAWAEVLEAENIFIGANAVDYSGYPDCRPEYLRSFESMANLATKASVTGILRFVIRAPLMYMKKADIIKKGTSLGLDYALTWSCYDPKPAGEGKSVPAKGSPAGLEAGSDQYPGYQPCGSCDSCIIRKKGFLEAGITDPFTSRT
jgi:7-cyano-7-deazaguanine synthase